VAIHTCDTEATQLLRRRCELVMSVLTSSVCHLYRWLTGAQ